VKTFIKRLFQTASPPSSAAPPATGKSAESPIELEQRLIPLYKQQLKQSLKQRDLPTHAQVAEKLIALQNAEGFHAKIKHLRQRGETSAQLLSLARAAHHCDPSPRSSLLLAQQCLDLEQLEDLPPLIEVLRTSDLPDAPAIELHYALAAHGRAHALQLFHQLFSSPTLSDESRARLFLFASKRFSSEMGDLALQQLHAHPAPTPRLLREFGAHFFTLRWFDSVEQTLARLQPHAPWDALALSCQLRSHRDSRHPHWRDAHHTLQSCDPDAARLLPHFWRQALIELTKYGNDLPELTHLAHTFFESQPWRASDLDLAIGLIRRLAQHSRADLESFVSLLKRKLWDPTLPPSWLGNTLLQTGKLADVLSHLDLFDFFLADLPLDLPRRSQAWQQAYDFATPLSCGAQNAALIHDWSHCQHFLFHLSHTYFDARVSADSRSQLMALFHDALRLKQPFSALRICDGEVYGFPFIDNLSPEQQQNERRICETHWWGRTIPPETRDYLINGFLQAVHSADLLGIPNAFRLLRDTDTSGADLFSRTSRSIVAVCQQVAQQCYTGQINVARTAFTDERFHHLLFGQFIDLLPLIQEASRVIIVSCYSANLIATHLPQLTDPHIIQIPPHTMTAELSDYPDKTVILPEVLPQLLIDLKHITIPGALILVAAGFAGKMFLHTAKEAGGVALDVGATLDYWLGLKTRSHVDLV
jgi:hypothetical protein